MQLIISAQDQVLAKYGNALAALGEGQARTAMSRAVNHEGDKGRTQVKRTLVKQTGIKHGAVEKAMATFRSTPATLTYTLKAHGDETNIVWFGGAPWNKPHLRAFGHRAEVRACFHQDVEEAFAYSAAVRPEPRARAGEGQQRDCVAERRCEQRRPCRPRGRSHAAAVMRIVRFSAPGLDGDTSLLVG